MTQLLYFQLKTHMTLSSLSEVLVIFKILYTLLQVICLLLYKVYKKILTFLIHAALVMNMECTSQ